MFKKLIYLAFAISFSNGVFAQLELTNTPVSDTLRPNLTKYIPPLYMLIDSAIANNPETKRYQYESEVFEHQMKVQNRSWLNDVNVGVSYTPLVNVTPQYTYLNGQFVPMNPNQNLVGFGSALQFSAKLPLNYLFTNSSEIKMLEAKSNAELQSAEYSSRLIAAQVTKLYNDLFAFQRMLEINQKAIQMGKMGVELGEEKFRNGQIELSELSQLYDLMTKYGLDYERSYAAYRSSYRDLETVVGVPLSKFKF
jgi:outer membrane protein TolC